MAKTEGAEKAKAAGKAAQAAKAAAKKDASSEKREADYAAAKERCDSLAGTAKDGCVTDAKVKYGM